MEAASESARPLSFIGEAGLETVDGPRFHDDARRMAAVLSARGVAPGSHVVLLGATSRPFAAAVEAVWWAGGCVAVLPLPVRTASREHFVRRTHTRIRQADAALVIADPPMARLLGPAPAGRPLVGLADLQAAAPGADARRQAPSPEDLAVLQFTSGSTADPKAVMVPHACVTANLDGFAAAASLDPGRDVLVSWLPLYHDLGLVMFLALSLTTGVEVVLAPPERFQAKPADWMRWMADFHGTLTAAPDFAYAVAARTLDGGPTLDLSSCRLAINGGEPIDPSTVERFCAAGGRHGLEPGSVACGYGLAEATLVVTFPRPGTGMTVEYVDRVALETDRRAVAVRPGSPGCRRLARLGAPIPGTDLRVVDPDAGAPLQERSVGEVEVAGASVTPGYYRLPAATRAAMHDGWLRTGDLGYLSDGELVVCGRLKDVIIVAGRNLYPEEVERAAAAVEGVRAGNVIAFGTVDTGRESLVVVAECRGDPGAVRARVARDVRREVGVTPADVVLVAPGTVPKTSSGKLMRSSCRRMYLEGELETL